MYRYGMRLRPASPGCQPKEGLVEIQDGDDKYYNFLLYDRKLTDKEISAFELTPMDECLQAEKGYYQRISVNGEETYNIYDEDGTFIGTFIQV